MKKITYLGLALIIASPSFAFANNITYVNETHKFSFAHSDKYLNQIEKKSKYEKEQCPSGDKKACEQENLSRIKGMIKEECEKNKNEYSSTAQCEVEELKKILEWEDLFKTEAASASVAPKDSGEFIAYDENDKEIIFDSFSYSVKGLDQQIYSGFGNLNDSISYKTVEHGSRTESNGKTYPTIYYGQNSFNPEVSYFFNGNNLIRKVDPMPSIYNFLFFDKETRQANHDLYNKTKSTVVKPYFKNSKGVTFYQINKGMSGGYSNLYCTKLNKIICFDIKAKAYAEKIGDKTYKSNLNQEKRIMDPIMKSFTFIDKTIKSKNPDPVATVKKPIAFVSMDTKLGTDEDEYIVGILKDVVDNAVNYTTYAKNSYKGFCKDEENNLSASLYFHGFNVDCLDSINNYAYSVNLEPDSQYSYYCVDDTGIGRIVHKKITGPSCK